MLKISSFQKACIILDNAVRDELARPIRRVNVQVSFTDYVGNESRIAIVRMPVIGTEQEIADQVADFVYHQFSAFPAQGLKFSYTG